MSLLLAVTTATLLTAEPSAQLKDAPAEKLAAARPSKGLAFEFGEHGLVGHGVVFSFEPSARLVVDAGMGAFTLEGGGWKGGVQGRFRLLSTELTPYVGLGLGAGWNPNGTLTRNFPSEGSASYDFRWLLTARATAGLEWLHSSGLTFRFGASYELPLRSDFQLVASSSDEAARGLRQTYGAGLGFSMAVGWRF